MVLCTLATNHTPVRRPRTGCGRLGMPYQCGPRGEAACPVLSHCRHCLRVACLRHPCGGLSQITGQCQRTTAVGWAIGTCKGPIKRAKDDDRASWYVLTSPFRTWRVAPEIRAKRDKACV